MIFAPSRSSIELILIAFCFPRINLYISYLSASVHQSWSYQFEPCRTSIGYLIVVYFMSFLKPSTPPPPHCVVCYRPFYGKDVGWSNSYFMLFGVGVFCRIVYCPFCCQALVDNVPRLGTRELIFSTIDYSVFYGFWF